VPLQVPLFYEGQTRTAALRWDAEWNERLFTAVEYQKVKFTGAAIDVPDLLGMFGIGFGEIDRVSLAANYWVGNGLGLFGSFAWHESRDTTPATGGGNPVPLVPDYVVQAGFTYVHPARITFHAAQTFVGPRTGARFVDF